MAEDHFERHNHHERVVDWNFNVVFDGNPAVTNFANKYHPLLKSHSGLYEPIPTQWLHATILRVGELNEYTQDEMTRVANKVQERVTDLNLPEFHFGEPLLIHGNVCFAIEPSAELEKLYFAVTESLEEVVGPERATKSPYGHFIAHTSLAYTKARDNESDTLELLQNVVIKPPSFTIKHMPLIKQKPTDGHYEWEVIQDIRLD